MVHDLYILRELLGPAVEVSAAGASFLTDGVADSASACVTYASGAKALCHASWYEPEKVRRMTLVGTQAMAEYDDLRAEAPVRILQRGYTPIEGIDSFGNRGLERFDSGERAPCIVWEEPLRRELATFVARIQGERMTQRVTPESVLAVTAMLEGIGRSLRAGGAPEEVRGIDA
jgi:predicted dehydrogenase